MTDILLRHRAQIARWVSEAADDGCFFDSDEMNFGPFFWNLYEQGGCGWMWRALSGYEKHLVASDYPTWAHLMASLRAFPSASEARRHGWHGKVEPCERKVRIRGIKFFLVIE